MTRARYVSILLLAGVGIFALCEVTSLRAQVHAQERQVATLREAHEQAMVELLSGHDTLCELVCDRLNQSEDSWRQALCSMDATANTFLTHTTELRGLIENRTDDLASMVTRESGHRRDAVARALKQATSNARDITAVKRRLLKDCRSLKESMVYPTVQLRGNGTVGSGVVIFSRPLAKRSEKDSADTLSTATGRSAKREPDQPCLTFILTAYHVVMEVTTEKCRDKLKDVRIMGAGDRLEEKKYEAQVMTFDRARDIALLQLVSRKPVPHVARFAEPQEIAAIEVFEPAYAVGCPLGNMPLPSAGEITTKQKRVGDQVFWMLNAPTYFGNSGGGVFRARDGKLIGVSSMIYTYGRKHPVVVPHLGLFVPAEVIFSWLDKEGFGFIYDPAREVPKNLASIRPAECRPGAGSGEATLERVGYRSRKGSL